MIDTIKIAIDSGNGSQVDMPHLFHPEFILRKKQQFFKDSYAGHIEVVFWRAENELLQVSFGVPLG